MKVVLALFALVAIVVADVVPIVSQDSAIDPDGKFFYSFESGDGTKAEQHGELKSFDKDTFAEVIQGSHSYVGDDGETYSLTYTADENGYHPEGKHLPVAPAIPEAIVRALAYIAAHPVKDDKKF